jgi:cell division protein FtsB
LLYVSKKSDMRFLAILIFFISGISAGLSASEPDSAIFAERDFYFKKYSSVKDTMTVNTWLNLKRLSDNLQEVVLRDQIIINQLLGQKQGDSSEIDSINQIGDELRHLRISNSQLASRSKNDFQMMWVLKTASSVLIVIVLVLIYLLITSKNRIIRYKKRQSEMESNIIEMQNQLLSHEIEVSKLKQREMDFRSELEKGLVAYQEKLSLLQKRNTFLEEEFSKIEGSAKNADRSNFHLPHTNFDIDNIPQDSEGVAIMLQTITDERDSLLNLAGKLQKQIQEEKEKYNKLVLMIKALPDESIDDSNF